MAKLTIFTDGASRGNPGAAGIGVVISDPEGNVLSEISEYIGETTNNVAEYTALIKGLEKSIELNADEVEISTDSELMARQITGVYKVKAGHLKDLHTKAISLLGCFRRVSISHVMREENRLADKLASQGASRKPQKISTKNNKPESLTTRAVPDKSPESNQAELPF